MPVHEGYSVNDKVIPKSEPVERPQGLYAKVGDGGWYPIPPNMEESFKAAGAEVVRASQLPGS